MGADVAGLFAIYAATKYPEVFGACGAFSPAIWYNKAELTNYLNAYHPTNTQTRFALAYTAQDMQSTKENIQSVAALLAQKGFTQIQTCEGTTTQAGFYYADGKTPQNAQMMVKEIPVDSKTYSYYWNMNNGADCNGTTLVLTRYT